MISLGGGQVRVLHYGVLVAGHLNAVESHVLCQGTGILLHHGFGQYLSLVLVEIQLPLAQKKIDL